MWDEAGRLTEWLGEPPIEAQLLKLSEEVGEVADVIITPAVALVMLSGGSQQAQAAFRAHLAGVLTRTGLAADDPGLSPDEGR
jgi:hypothetical protein